MDIFLFTVMGIISVFVVCGIVKEQFAHYKAEQHRKQVFNYLYADMLKGGKAE